MTSESAPLRLKIFGDCIFEFFVHNIRKNNLMKKYKFSSIF